MSSDKPWDPSKVNFPGNDQQIIVDVQFNNEMRNISVFCTAPMEDTQQLLDDHYDDPDIHPLPCMICAVQGIQQNIGSLDGF